MRSGTTSSDLLASKSGTTRSSTSSELLESSKSGTMRSGTSSELLESSESGAIRRPAGTISIPVYKKQITRNNDVYT